MVLKADDIADQLDQNTRAGEETTFQARQRNLIHIQFQQRTTRKCMTIVQGLPDDLDMKKINRYFKKTWNCNGAVIDDEEHGSVIQLQGDHRKAVADFLQREGIADKKEIKIHGF